MELTITGGEHKGRKLHIPARAPDCRPTLNKVREAVFNILGQDLQSYLFVDSFAGSGVMGIEALSRGAEKVLFFEKDSTLINILHRNLRFLSDTRYELHEGDFFQELSPSDLMPGIIYLDPPQANKIESLTLDFLSSRITSPSLLILECHLRRTFTIPDCYTVHKKREYGNTKVYFLEL